MITSLMKSLLRIIVAVLKGFHIVLSLRGMKKSTKFSIEILNYTPIMKKEKNKK